jgi:hypothetical protein
VVAAPRIERQRQQQSRQFVGLVCAQPPVRVRLNELPDHLLGHYVERNDNYEYR